MTQILSWALTEDFLHAANQFFLNSAFVGNLKSPDVDLAGQMGHFLTFFVVKTIFISKFHFFSNSYLFIISKSQL